MGIDEKERRISETIVGGQAMIRKKLILIADSDRTTFRQISRFLANRGHKVVTATKGPTVLRLVEKEKSPALAILETHAVAQDGIEVSHYLHKFSKMPAIILIAEMLKW